VSLATDSAMQYAELGWSVVPAPLRGKSPLGKWEKHKTERLTGQKLKNAFGSTEKNIFVICGPVSRLAVLDTDNEAARDYWRERLGPVMDETTSATSGRESGEGRHFYFRLAEGEIHKDRSADDGSWTLRASGGVIAPPSLHESGTRYAWAPERGPEALQDALAALWAGDASAPDSGPTEARSKLADLLANPPAEGGGNNWLTDVAGHYAKALSHEDGFAETVRALAPAWLTDAETENLIKSIWSKEHAKEDGATTYPLLSIDDLSRLTPPSWLIDGHLPESGFSTVYGPPGVGKSFLVLDWALSVASGTEWIAYNVKQCPVLYITAEGVSGLYRRIQAWCADRKCEPPANFLALPEAVNLLDEHSVHVLRATIATMPNPPGLIIADTLARMIEGGDENSAKDVGKAIAVLTRLAGEYNAASAFVHHTRADGDRERGSTALRGASDMMAELKPSGDFVNLVCTKMKNWEEFNPFLLHLAKAADSCVFQLGRPEGHATDGATTLSHQVAELFGYRWATSKELKEAIEMERSAFYRGLNTLLKRGILEAEEPDKRNTRYRLVRDD
jgi:AAA domain/Bifunctional DNA primase/polymerase, N-terminal